MQGYRFSVISPRDFALPKVVKIADQAKTFLDVCEAPNREGRMNSSPPSMNRDRFDGEDR